MFFPLVFFPSILVSSTTTESCLVSSLRRTCLSGGRVYTVFWPGWSFSSNHASTWASLSSTFRSQTNSVSMPVSSV
jgi:hypothetical protein